MALEDYVPNIFGGTPTVYQGLLSPQEQASLEKRSNLAGLLGFGAALAQGMGGGGYRRSALQNILSAAAQGFSGAGQTYQAGIGQMSDVMKLKQARRQIEGLQNLRERNPDLAYLADVSPEEFVKQVAARERFKSYGLGGAPTTLEPTQASVSPSMESAPPVEPSATPTFNKDLPFAIPTERSAPVTLASPVVPVSALPQQAPYFAGVSPENKSKAQLFRQKAAFAAQNGDTGIATYLNNEADRLDPKEQVFFRDGKAFSTTRGLIADVSGKRVLTDAEATSMSLDPRLGKWQISDNIPALIPNTGVSPEYQKAQLIAGLPSQFSNLHPTLQPQANALIARAGSMDKSQIVSETERILSAQSKILAELNPQLQAAGKAKAPQVNVYTGDLSKTTVGKVEEGVLTSAEAMSRLNSIYGSYRPEYLNVPFRAKQEWTNLAGKFKDVSPQDKQILTGYYEFKQNALQNLNKTIKDLTGAAMGVQEADRIIASLPNAGSTILGGDSPVEFEAKLNNAVQQTKYALARQTYALKSGIKKDAWEKIPLSDMPTIVNKRASEIAKAYKLDPNKEADKQTIKRQLAAEFGIPF
jgi:hypothetical protein